MFDLITNVCFLLDSTRKEKCTEFITEYLDLLILIINSKLFFLILIIILFITFKILFIDQKNDNNKLIFSLSLFFLFFIILSNFKTNIPWVDDWEWIENLQLKKNSTIDWLFQPANIHNIFFIKLIFLSINNFFNLNFEIFSFLSIIMLLIISIIILKNEKHLDNIYLILIILFVFSGKQFANISQASNIAWTICFFYIVLFRYLIDNIELKNLFYCSILILVSPFTFGLGYVIPIYVIFFIYFHKFSRIIKINYIIISIFSIFISYYFPRIFFYDSSLSNSTFDILNIIFNYKFYLTFFGVLANVYLPWINGFAYLGFVIGFIQIVIIFYYLIKNYLKLGFLSLNQFFIENIFIILGIIFALIVAITRSDEQTIVAARYSVGSILFQMGFWIYFSKNKNIKKSISTMLFKILMLYVFLSGVLFPYQGIHWQAKRYFENSKVILCFKENSSFDYCTRNAYEILFYNGEWYNFEDFKSQLKILKKNNKSFFNY